MTEDIEVSWRLQHAGFALAYEPRALFTIQAPPSYGALLRQRRRWAQGMVEVLRHHGGVHRAANPALLAFFGQSVLGLTWAIVLIPALGWMALSAGTASIDAYAVLMTGALFLIQAVSACILDAHYRRESLRLMIYAPLYPLYFWGVTLPSLAAGVVRGLRSRGAGRWDRTERVRPDVEAPAADAGRLAVVRETSALPTLPRRRSGFTLVELIVTLSLVGLLLSLLLPVLQTARATAIRVRDAAQVGQIHAAWVIAADSRHGRYPTPGLIDRVGSVPGRGAEDLQLNDSASLYSACIAQNYMPADLVVSVAEQSAVVSVKDDYDFAHVSPADDQWWDGSFVADLNEGSNTSYAHCTLTGQRKRRHWRTSAASNFAIVATRGAPPGFDGSLTSRLHRPFGQWSGNLCFNDNHVSFERTPMPEAVHVEDRSGVRPDHLFAEDSPGQSPGAPARVGAGADIWLTLTTAVGADDDVHLTWD